MEDTLGDGLNACKNAFAKVLILVLMEDTLGERYRTNTSTRITCLNPCSNGRYSRRLKDFVEFTNTDGLNPCSNGRYSRS